MRLQDVKGKALSPRSHYKGLVSYRQARCTEQHSNNDNNNNCCSSSYYYYYYYDHYYNYYYYYDDYDYDYDYDYYDYYCCGIQRIQATPALKLSSDAN